MKTLKFSFLFFLSFLFSKPLLAKYASISTKFHSEIIVNIADSDKKREIGLMFIKKLKKTNGMLFLYPYPQNVNIWMHKTILPLDILFINKDNRVLSIKTGVPFSKDLISSGSKVSAVLEIPRGCAKKLEINEGDILFWEIIKKEKKQNIRYYHCLDY